LGLALPERFNAAHTLCADSGCVTGVRWQHQPISGSEISVAHVGVEDDPAADTVQHLLVAVLMPAVRIARGVTQPWVVRPSAHRRAMISSSPGGEPSCRSTRMSIVTLLRLADEAGDGWLASQQSYPMAAMTASVEVT